MFLQLTGINTPQEDSYIYSKAKATFMKYAKYQQNIDAKNTIHTSSWEAMFADFKP